MSNLTLYLGDISLVFSDSKCAYESKVDGNTNTLNRKYFSGIIIS